MRNIEKIYLLFKQVCDRLEEIVPESDWDKFKNFEVEVADGDSKLLCNKDGVQALACLQPKAKLKNPLELTVYACDRQGSRDRQYGAFFPVSTRIADRIDEKGELSKEFSNLVFEAPRSLLKPRSPNIARIREEDIKAFFPYRYLFSTPYWRNFEEEGEEKRSYPEAHSSKTIFLEWAGTLWGLSNSD